MVKQNLVKMLGARYDILETKPTLLLRNQYVSQCAISYLGKCIWPKTYPEQDSYRRPSPIPEYHKECHATGAPYAAKQAKEAENRNVEVSLQSLMSPTVL